MEEQPTDWPSLANPLVTVWVSILPSSPSTWPAGHALLKTVWLDTDRHNGLQTCLLPSSQVRNERVRQHLCVYCPCLLLICLCECEWDCSHWHVLWHVCVEIFTKQKIAFVEFWMVFQVFMYFLGGLYFTPHLPDICSYLVQNFKVIKYDACSKWTSWSITLY